MNETTFIPAQSVFQASRLMKDHSASEAVFMAGGTDILVLQRHRLIAPQVIIYLKRISGLTEIRPGEGGGLIIGALATLDEVARHPSIRQSYPMLAEAAFAVASPQIRHKATLGGNICLNSRCWFYDHSPFWRAEYPECRKASADDCDAIGEDKCYIVPKNRKNCFGIQSGDCVGPLAALGAKVRLVSNDGERVLNVEDFFLGDDLKYLDLKSDEILTEVLLPPPTQKGVFLKFRPQNNLDFASFTLSVLPSHNGGGSRIVAACVASRPLRARKAEAMLDRGVQDPEVVAQQASKELKIISPVRGSVAFKKQVIQAKLAEILVDFKRNQSQN